MSVAMGSLLALLTVALFSLLPILAIVFGIVALIKIKNSRGRLKGAGLAWAGIILGFLLLFLAPAVAGMFWVGARVEPAEGAQVGGPID